MNKAISYIKKSALRLFVVVASCIIAKQFCYAKTDGFAIRKIHATLRHHPEWETQGDLPALCSQPFRYLAKGAQSYVFASEDGQCVIKFFRVYHLRPPLWLRALHLPLPLQPYRLAKFLEKNQELEKDFNSYKIAFDQMKEETGILYLHLNQTKHLNQTLTIYDKLGIAHTLNLDDLTFVVQKRATLVYPYIEKLMQNHEESEAKKAIHSLVHLLHSRCQRGIFDKDPDLNTNFGFCENTAVQIDIGRFRQDIEMNPRHEILRITDHLHQWLGEKYPALSTHLMQEIEACTDPAL